MPGAAIALRRGRGTGTGAEFRSGRPPATRRPAFVRDRVRAPGARYQLKPAPPITLFSPPLKAPPSDTLARSPTARW